jgi:hypothetical protein
LFKYASEQTSILSAKTQNPTIIGNLSEPLSEYQRKPEIIQGLSAEADEKTAYRKILAICRTLDGTRHPKDLSSLYDALLARYSDSFQTLYKTAKGQFIYRPVNPTVVGRYIRLLRALHLVDDEELRLSSSGKILVSSWEKTYNQRLLRAIDNYLARLGITRDDIERALQQILANRGVPSRTEIIDYLSLGQSLPKDTLGIILDLLGYMRAIRMSPGRAYFPW